jgi:hypothetical protein
VSRVGLGFRPTQNLGFSVRVRASFIILGFDLTVALRRLLVSLCRIFCLRRFGDESSRLGFSSNPKRVFLRKARCEPLFIFLGLT